MWRKILFGKRKIVEKLSWKDKDLEFFEIPGVFYSVI